MFEKFKAKCKELSRNGAVVFTVVCLLLALTVVLSVTIATNRAKKKYENTTESGAVQETVEETNKKPPIQDGTIQAPTHNETESLPVSGEVEEFMLSLPTQGIISKGHDSTIQVWSETMGDYRVHLGLDIVTDEDAPVYAAADGVVEKVWDDALMGRCVAISHGDNIFTFYKNLDATLESDIVKGKTIERGQKIGTVGNTAIAELADEPHLHIEMTVNGLAVDPRDYFSEEAKQSMSKDNSYEGNAGSDGK